MTTPLLPLWRTTQYRQQHHRRVVRPRELFKLPVARDAHLEEALSIIYELVRPNVLLSSYMGRVACSVERRHEEPVI